MICSPIFIVQLNAFEHRSTATPRAADLSTLTNLSGFVFLLGRLRARVRVRLPFEIFGFLGHGGDVVFLVALEQGIVLLAIEQSVEVMYARRSLV